MKRSKEEAIEFIKDIATINGHELKNASGSIGTFLYCKHCKDIMWEIGLEPSRRTAIDFAVLSPCGSKIVDKHIEEEFLITMHKEFEGSFY